MTVIGHPQIKSGAGSELACHGDMPMDSGSTNSRFPPEFTPCFDTGREWQKVMKLKFKKGISLIELVVTAGLFVIISGLLVVMIVRSFSSYRYSQETIDAQEKTAMAMRDFEKSTRGATEILDAEPAQLTFYTYLLEDVQPAPSRVRYYIDGNKLMKGVVHPSGAGPIFDYIEADEFSKPIAENVTNTSLIFTYFNAASVQIANPVPSDAVRMIKFSVTVDKDTTQPPDAITTTTTVNLRNLKTNL